MQPRLQAASNLGIVPAKGSEVAGTDPDGMRKSVEAPLCDHRMPTHRARTTLQNVIESDAGMSPLHPPCPVVHRPVC
jgi:hypothetical protein